MRWKAKQTRPSQDEVSTEPTAMVPSHAASVVREQESEGACGQDAEVRGEVVFASAEFVWWHTHTRAHVHIYTHTLFLTLQASRQSVGVPSSPSVPIHC